MERCGQCGERAPVVALITLDTLGEGGEHRALLCAPCAVTRDMAVDVEVPRADAPDTQDAGALTRVGRVVVRAKVAEFGPDGTLLNPEHAIGELVNTTGAGAFAGYYNDADAEAERMRGGMYWSGDLAYRDAQGFVFFAGRTADWLRVDGENLAAAPLERILLRHPSVSEAAVYAVPDPAVGDQVMAALVLTGPLDPPDLEEFLRRQADLSTKGWPCYVRLVPPDTGLPRTATNKVLKRELAAAGPVPGDGQLWVRDERGTAYALAEGRTGS